jgi:hypothetical protein
LKLAAAALGNLLAGGGTAFRSAQIKVDMTYVQEGGWNKLTPDEQERGMAAYMAFTEALRKVRAPFPGPPRFSPTLEYHRCRAPWPDLLNVSLEARSLTRPLCQGSALAEAAPPPRRENMIRNVVYGIAMALLLIGGAARADDNDAADQKVAADKAAVAQDNAKVNADKTAVKSAHEQVVDDRQQLAKDRAAHDQTAVSADEAKVAADKSALKAAFQQEQADKKQRREDRHELRKDRREDRREDRGEARHDKH